jgi:5-methylcytosine-specific restriction endonuclease McrA
MFTNLIVHQKHDFGARPICVNKGCKREQQFMGTYRKDGTPHFRKLCAPCHYKSCAEKKGQSVTEWTNAMHEYRKYRKNYCENRDGRLGYICRYTIKFSGQLQVDHKNGKPTDNRPANLQTFCANCHIYKTHLNEDFKSPGRKTLHKMRAT